MSKSGRKQRNRARKYTVTPIDPTCAKVMGGQTDHFVRFTNVSNGKIECDCEYAQSGHICCHIIAVEMMLNPHKYDPRPIPPNPKSYRSYKKRKALERQKRFESENVR